MRRVIPFVAWLALGSLGCPKRDAGDAERRALLDALDAGWNTFPAPDVLPDAIDPGRVTSDLDRIAAARARWPIDAEIGWRAIRLQVAAGKLLDAPHDARRAYARGREAGVQCIQGASGRWVDPDGRVTAPVERAACIAWTAEAWTRWMDTWQPDAARIDEPVVSALLDAVRGVPDEPVRRVAGSASTRLRRLRTGTSQTPAEPGAAP